MIRHDRRTSNRKVVGKKKKKMLKILIPGVIIIITAIMIVGGIKFRWLMGASVGICNYECEEGWTTGKNNICYLESEDATKNISPYVLGDTNNDGFMNAKDFNQLNSDITSEVELDNIKEAIYDINQDGEVNAEDIITFNDAISSTSTVGTVSNQILVCPTETTITEQDEEGNEITITTSYELNSDQCIAKIRTEKQAKQKCPELENIGHSINEDNSVYEEEEEQSSEQSTINMTLKDNLSVTDLKVNFKHNPVNITYEVSDEKIAYINNENKIVPKKRGTTNIEITAFYESGDKETKNITLNIVNHYRSVFNITNSNNKFFVDGETLVNDLRSRGIIDSETNYRISAQSMIVLDKKFVVAISVEIQDSKEKLKDRITKGIQSFFYIYDIDSKQIDIRKNSCGHSNGLTYNNKEEKILCVDGSKSNKNTIFVYPKSFITSTVSEKNSPEEVEVHLNEVKIDYGNINENNSVDEHRYVNIAYDKDRDIYYLAENQKRYILKLKADLKTAEYLKFAKSNSSFELEVKNKNNKVRFRNNQNIVYKNDYVYLINCVGAENTDIYNSYEYTSQPGDSIIYGFNVDSGERGDILYQRSYNTIALGNTKEIQDIYFSGQAESQYILFQKSVYLTKGKIVKAGGFTIFHNNDNFDIMIDINKIS